MKSLREQVDSIAWFHRIDLGDVIITPGINDSSILHKIIWSHADFKNK